jgi:ATP-dependent DNA helicase HFM1/MER3
VVSAPTGSGKTALFEMALVRLLEAAAAGGKPPKAVYIAPTRALCDERLADWTAKFARLPLKIVKVTGDSSFADASVSQLASGNLILTTPEKLDAISRRWRDHIYLLGTIRLLMIDEVHTITDEGRGATLEAVVCRMKTVQAAAALKSIVASPMRFVAVSATMPNIQDVGAFLQCKSDSIFSFDESYRPVPLQTVVKACGNSKNQYFFEKSLSNYVPSILGEYSGGRPALIFCHSKKDCETLAKDLGMHARYTNATNRGVLQAAAGQTRTAALSACLGVGTAFHHAGLPSEDRMVSPPTASHEHVQGVAGSMMTYKTTSACTIMRVAGSATSAMRKPQILKRVRNDEA